MGRLRISICYFQSSKLDSENENHKIVTNNISSANLVDELQAVLARLRFLRLFLQVLLAFGKKEVGRQLFLMTLVERLDALLIFLFCILVGFITWLSKAFEADE